MKIAICISAYRCEKYIMDCIKSIRRQSIPPECEIDIRIGVDGCEDTHKVLVDNKINHWYSKENVGTYIVRNSLIYLESADIYMYFDADDIMLEDYISHNICFALSKKIVMAKKINVTEELKPDPTCRIIDEGRGGAMTFTHEILELLGGYQHYRVSCDCDFINRAKKAGITRFLIPRQLYMRRRHKNALTVNKDTNIKSEYRNDVVKEMKEKRNKGLIRIEPKTISLEYFGFEK